MVGTLPGRTQGLGLITEPLLADLRLDRVAYANLNLWATLIGASFAIGVGRLVDRLGARLVLTLVALALGAVVCAMSRVSTFVHLALLITLTRGLGQSALSVVSIATVGHWFVRRIDAAMAVYTVVLSVGFMAAFPIVGATVQSRGWRAAWLAVGIALLAGLAPLAWLFVRRPPEAPDQGQTGVKPGPDRGQTGVRPGSDQGQTGVGLGSDQGQTPVVERQPPETTALESDTDGVRWQAALASPAFWIFGSGAALYGLVASGIGLFNESIL